MSDPTDEQNAAEEAAPEEIVPGVARALSPLVRRILALNAGPDTGLGTNTYLVGIDEILVIDPGPDDASHVDAVAGCGGDRVRWIIATSDDPEHAGATKRLAKTTGAEVLDDLDDGAEIVGTEFRLTVHHRGPRQGHLVLLLEEERVLFSGDLIVHGLEPEVADVDGYQDSLGWARKQRLRRVAPGHGHLIEDPGAHIDERLSD